MDSLYDDTTETSSQSLRELPPAHYYGDIVRRLFLLGGAIMLLSYPFFETLTSVPVWGVTIFILVISIVAGLQSPRYRWSAIINTGIATFAFCSFEYKAASFYLSDRYWDHPFFFWANQFLALIFFFAVYFSIKSTRANKKSRFTSKPSSDDIRTP